MMKKLIFITSILFLTACSARAPEPKHAKGQWYDLNTTIEAVKAETYS